MSPTAGTIATIFNFDASGCTDHEDSTSALQVRWNWENDATWDSDYSTIKIVTHQYSSPGSIMIHMQARDSGALTDNFTRQISVTGSDAETGTVMDIDGNIYKTIKIAHNGGWRKI